MRVVTYARVSTREQAENGHGLDAQETRLVAEIGQRGWERVDTYVDDGLSGAQTAALVDIVDRFGIEGARDVYTRRLEGLEYQRFGKARHPRSPE